MKRGENVAAASSALAAAHAHVPCYNYARTPTTAEVKRAQEALKARELTSGVCRTTCACRARGSHASAPTTEPLVSVVCPTTSSRRGYHEVVVRCFRAQTWRRKELIVFDTDGPPSSTFAGLEDVRYIHAEGHVTLGDKRKLLVNSSRGDIVAHFDDDNVYGPMYLQVMVTHCLAAGVDLVSLSGWTNFRAGLGRLERTRFRAATGRGETFVHLRPLPSIGGDEDRSIPFPPIDKGASSSFVSGVAVHNNSTHTHTLFLP